MSTSPRALLALVGRRTMVVAGALTAALVLVATLPGLLGSDVTGALHQLDQARPTWLWLAALGFVGSLAGSALAWRSALTRSAAASASSTRARATAPARSSTRSSRPARATPSGSGCSPGRCRATSRLWTTGGAYAALGAARAVVLSVLVVAGSLAGVMPLWPVSSSSG